MKIQAEITQVKGLQIAAKVGKAAFRPGDRVIISKGGVRSVSQNSFYWTYLTYLIVNHLQEHGHFSPQGLHESLKQYFIAEKKMEKGEWKAIEQATTTTLTKQDFADYIEKIDNFVCDFFKVDTSEFFQEYQDIYRPGG